MFYELLVGELPFSGPDYADFRDQHLHHDPPELDGVPDSLAALLRECMYRSPNARPRAANVLERLRRNVPGRGSGGLADLEAANRATVAERSQRDRAESRARSEAEAREALARDARTALDHIGERLRSMIADAAPAASLNVPRPTNWTLALGDAELSLTGPMSVARGTVEQFDVVLSAILGLQIPQDRDGFQGRAHSLWFCDAQVEGEYRWFERPSR